MATSIFGANSQAEYMGAFRTTSGAGNNGVTFGDGGDVSLIQNLQVSHQQPVQNLFEVGSNKRYYVIGKASGTFSASQILGFGNKVLDTVTKLADPCSGGRRLTITFPNAYCRAPAIAGGAAAGGVVASTQTKGETLQLTMDGVLLQSISFSVAAQDNLINSQVQGLMTELQYETNAGR